MKKVCKFLITLALTLSVIGMGTSIHAEEDAPEEMEFKDVKLTEQQLAELEALYEEVIKQRKTIIDKYLELGVIETEKAEKMKKHLDEHFEKLKGNGFIPKWHKHKHHKHEKD